MDPLREAFLHGVYYNPATKHYDDAAQVVQCDRCFASPLRVCVGLATTDLCMRCVAQMDEEAAGVGVDGAAHGDTSAAGLLDVFLPGKATVSAAPSYPPGVYPPNPATSVPTAPAPVASAAPGGKSGGDNGAPDRIPRPGGPVLRMLPPGYRPLSRMRHPGYHAPTSAPK